MVSTHLGAWPPAYLPPPPPSPRTLPCITGLPSVAALLSSSPLPVTCTCPDPTSCTPVIVGSAHLGAPQLSDKLSLGVATPPNPFLFLQGVPSSMLQCNNGGGQGRGEYDCRSMVWGLSQCCCATMVG